MEDYPFEWMQKGYRLEINIRFYIFLITGVCAGLPALAWSVSDLIHHRRNGHRISAFILLLLLTDFVEIFLSPYILIKHLLNEFRCTDWTCRVMRGLWWSSRVCGLLLNKLVALEGILSVKYPLYAVSVFSSPCLIIFYLFVFLCWLIGMILLHSVYDIIIVISVFVVSVIMWIISCGASCFADRHSHTSRKPDPHILVVFIFSLLVFYLYLAAHILLYAPDFHALHNVFLIPWFLLSLRLISDPLLCVLVCRQNLSIQTSQNPER